MNWKRFFRRGIEPAEARAAARRKLGNTTLIREEVYQMNTVMFVENVVRDVPVLMNRQRLLENPCPSCWKRSRATQ